MTSEVNDAPMAPVSSGEVEKVVFAMGAQKSPGPDGFNGEFYQKNWETIKQNVTKAVMEFFISNAIGETINDTIVALIPKVPHPESIGQLRHISCCNYIYKIISKIFVTRPKPHLQNLISPQQSAFVEGRLIQDNLVVA